MFDEPHMSELPTFGKKIVEKPGPVARIRPKFGSMLATELSLD